MTLDLDAIRGRCDAATEGPWFINKYGGLGAGKHGIGQLIVQDWAHDWSDAERKRHGADVTFIAHARTDVPALLSAVDGLVKALSDIMPFITDERNTDPENARITEWWAQHAETLKDIPRPGSPEREAMLQARAQLAALARKGERT